MDRTASNTDPRPVRRRRRWLVEQKKAMVRETYLSGMSVALVASRHGIAPNQLHTWRRLYPKASQSPTAGTEDVVPAAEYRALESQMQELLRVLGEKTMENEILRKALRSARSRTEPSLHPHSPDRGSGR